MLTDTRQSDLHYQGRKTVKRNSTSENRSTLIRVVEIVPVRVVEIVPVRLTVVEMVPVLVVEIVPALVVEMVPVFAGVIADIVMTNDAAKTNDLRFFISLLLVIRK